MELLAEVKLASRAFVFLVQSAHEGARRRARQVLVPNPLYVFVGLNTLCCKCSECDLVEADGRDLNECNSNGAACGPSSNYPKVRPHVSGTFWWNRVYKEAPAVKSRKVLQYGKGIAQWMVQQPSSVG